ncbi:2OG-Fe(II) oxygenase [Dongia sedimenti]|uniref:2OG-Fe(II) oxygenase n=1 Tax=Dongia sedimenti TaxID=3064282 RepID=A0ABU0YHY5_9PROT|nr:2OG-Fe(II) oxygenase [Rhodospirillaceae bacterium R-7]
MAVSQTTAPIAAKQPLEAGDIAPAFRLAATSGESIDPASDLVAGKPLLLLFWGGGALPQGLEALVGQVKATDGRAVLATGLGETAALDGFESAADAEGTVGALFGASGESRLVLIAPNRHVAYIGGDAAAAQAALARIAATRAAVTMTSHPPVLIVPDVLSRAECQKLINIFAMQGQTFVEPGHGTLPPGNADYKQKIPEYGRKDRIDHWIRQPETNAFIDDRLNRRLIPEIQKSFQYKITRREAYRIGCYEGERGGELHGHRDNTKPMVAHRRFACSINLNTEQFEGGELRYPEFGNQLYRPETGAAITFSCSLLHEPMHVTKGRRFVLLAFLYGET